MAPQSPLPYNRENSTATSIAADNASNIAGKVVLTTGVSPGGLGATFVETIAQHKPRLLILAGRSRAKVQATADKITSQPANEGVQVRVLILDLASQKQIRDAAKEVLAYEESIDVLVNSAGLMAGPYQTTKDGLELQFGSNHIGHFLFTNLIMPKVLASNNPRIINVSSNGHKLSPIRFEDWNFQDGKAYHQWRAYGQSKTANVLFSKALAEKLGSTKKLRAYSLHPGVIFETSLAPQGVTDADWAEMAALNKELGIDLPLIKMKTLDEGTACHVVAAFDTRLGDFNGAYLEDGNLSDDVTATATDPEEAEKLWKLSEKLVGQTFDY